MTNSTEQQAAPDVSELDSLEVVEAEELQEGVAFHAFRFKV